jgi:hypothetical protein
LIEINHLKFHLLPNQAYTGAFDKLKFECFNCPKKREYFETRPGSIGNGRNCSPCDAFYLSEYNNLNVVYPEVAKEWDYEKNYPIRPENIFAHTEKKFWWKCSVCDSSYLSSVSKRTGDDARGCPFCVESRLEQRIKRFLDANNIFYIFQKRFDECRDVNPLPFDFFIENYNILCEAQGKQHYKPIKFFGGVDSFNIRIKHDQMKRGFCKIKNIKLIEIPYWDFNNIEFILSRELNLLSLEERRL